MNINEIDLNLLRVFHVMSEERSVTRTADRLALSQPAVSNTLRRLRHVFDDALFVRGQGGMVPTPRASDLVEPISEALQRIEVALAGGPDVDPSRISEPISIICADEEILLHGSDILAALERDGCRAPIQFIPLSTDYRVDILWRARLSVTISTMLFAPDGLKQRKVYDEHLVCLLRADHPAAARLDFDAYLAADHLLIAPLGGAPEGYLDTWLRDQGRKRSIRLVSHSFGSAGMLVRSTGLLATLPSRQAQRLSADGDLVIRPLPFEAPPFAVHIFWSERFDKDPVNTWLRRSLYQAMLSDPIVASP